MAVLSVACSDQIKGLKNDLATLNAEKDALEEHGRRQAAASKVTIETLRSGLRPSSWQWRALC